MGDSIRIALLFVFVPMIINAQQLDQIGKGEAIRINGGLNVNQVYRYSDNYHISSPYSIVMAGNFSTSLYGWSIPLSFTWSNYQWTYTQPFNQLSLHPSYKWVTLHIGYSSMNFSPWSLSGHSFAGVGVDISPGSKFKMSAMYGRLLKSTPGDSIHGVLPTYRRIGSGFKAEYSFSKAMLGASVFYAADDKSYLPSADSAGITPKENLVLGLQTRISLIQNVELLMEGNTSLVAEDRRLGKVTDMDGNSVVKYYAYKAALSWSLKWAQIGGTFEHVDPGYKTLGAYYTAEDYINYTFDFATSLFQQKVNLAVNTGVRENNIDNKSDQEATDRINNISIAYTPNQKLTFSASYSNFYNYTYIHTVFDESQSQTPYELLDTVSYTQISENMNLSGNYSFGNKEKRPQSMMANISYQKAGQKQSDNPDHTNSEFLNGTYGYTYGYKPWEINCGLNINYTLNKSQDDNNQMFGPMVYVRKSFFDKKLMTRISCVYSNSTNNGNNTGSSFNTRLGVSYRLKNVHNFNFSFVYGKRNNKDKEQVNITASLGYSYNFGWPKEKGEKNE